MTQKTFLAVLRHSIVLALICCFGFNTAFAACTSDLFAGGDGTIDNPYQISTPQQLQNVNQCLGTGGAENNQDKYYVLNNDIDLTDYLSEGGAGYNGGAGWLPIGSGSGAYAFYGKLNGNGYKVSGLWISRTPNYVGLFGYVNSAEIRNIGVEIGSSNIKGGQYTGGLAGYNITGTISNSYVVGSVTGTYNVGGLVGCNDNNGTISNSYATGSVTGTNNNVGGLVGYNYNNGTISNSYATGSVTGASNVGGLVGYNYNNGTISNSYATGSVTGASNVGGLAGNNYSATISNSYYDKETTGQSDTGKGEGKSTSDMENPSTYEGWDNGIWAINSGSYPSLLWQNPAHIASAATAIHTQTWTGDSIKPVLNLALRGRTLIEKTDFEYAYQNNTQVGTAKLKVIGMGDFAGQQATLEFSIIPAECGVGFEEGEGTQEKPYKIKNAKNLDAVNNCIGSSYSGKYYELQNNIDLKDYLSKSIEGWLPIGAYRAAGDYFYGKFNGNGYKVLGLWINRTNYVGLFGYAVDVAEIRNIGVEIGDKGIKGINYVGGLAGYNLGKISNSYATGSVFGTGSGVGGLAGHNTGTISNSYATGNVSGGQQVGGLAGYNTGTIRDSYAVGSVSGTDVGGLAGYNLGKISNSYYDQQSTGQTDTGKGVGKSTSDMENPSTYEGWDNGIWAINPGSYPALLWQDPAHIANATAIILAQTWTGEPIKPKPSLVLRGRTLIEEEDFVYDYHNNTQVGTTAKLKVIGIGGFAGQLATLADFSIIPDQCGTGFAGGEGTETNPYKIANAKNLAAIGNCLGTGTPNNNQNKYYELQNNINLEEYLSNSIEGWLPIGTSNVAANSFYGKLTGNGYKVLGLWINRTADYVGLFGYANSASISEIGVEIGSKGIKGTNYAGGLAGYSTNIISSSYATGSVSGTEYVGGLVGRNNNGTIRNSYATVSVAGTGNNVGGLVGYNYGNGSISNSYAKGSVAGTGNNVGGLAGFNTNANKVTYSYYDIDGTGQTDTGKGVGKSTPEMKNPDTYEGWDFTIWYINNDYPVLRWQLTSTEKGAEVASPTLASKTRNSITINAIPSLANGQVVEYAINTADSLDGLRWKKDLEFIDLFPSTDYYIFARSADNGIYNAGKVSAPLQVKTENENVPLCNGFEDGTTRLHEGKNKAQFCDERDGTKYVYVDIGKQTWMAENLRYRGEDGKMGRCAEGQQENCVKYGRLYTMDEMYCKDGCKTVQGGVADPSEHAINIACPAGWHLPSTTELEELLKFSDPNFVRGSDATGGGKNSSAIKLKVEGWGTGANEGTDEFGFSALPGGYCGSGCPNVAGGTVGVGVTSFWWSHAYGFPVPLVKSWNISNSATVNDAFQSYSTSAFYTRCLKDNEPEQEPPKPEPVPATIACEEGEGTAGQECHYGQWKNYFTDERDSKEYPYVKIGEQVWMAANLDYNTTAGSKCYNDLNENCENYGRLYNFATANNACPSGWRLPTNTEWTALTTTVGGLTGTAAKLKAGSGWASNGTDDYGFAALPSGAGSGYWWTSSVVGANGAQIRHIGPTSADITSTDNDKSNMNSVRCITDHIDPAIQLAIEAIKALPPLSSSDSKKIPNTKDGYENYAKNLVSDILNDNGLDLAGIEGTFTPATSGVPGRYEYWLVVKKQQPKAKVTAFALSKPTVTSEQEAIGPFIIIIPALPSNNSPAPNGFAFADIQYWVGTGENKAILIIQWNDGKSPTALAWGYKWNGSKNGSEMIDDIAKADPRLFYLRHATGPMGYAIAGIGYNASGSNGVSLNRGGTCTTPQAVLSGQVALGSCPQTSLPDPGVCKAPVNGSIETQSYDYDYWMLCNGSSASARWQSGWYEAYWSYWVSSDVSAKWAYSGMGTSSVPLANNGVQAWYYDVDMGNPTKSTYVKCMLSGNDCDGREYFGTIVAASSPVVTPPSGGGYYPTPTFPNQETPAIASIGLQTIGNAILLSNLPSNAKVEVYNLQGKRVFSAYTPENPKILAIGVQTGMYVVKVGSQIMKATVK